MDARLLDATRKTGIFRRPTYGCASFLTELCGFVRLGSRSTNPLDVRRFPKGQKSGVLCFLQTLERLLGIEPRMRPRTDATVGKPYKVARIVCQATFVDKGFFNWDQEVGHELSAVDVNHSQCDFLTGWMEAQGREVAGPWTPATS
jgi:hypothetical protein